MALYKIDSENDLTNQEKTVKALVAIANELHSISLSLKEKKEF